MSLFGTSWEDPKTAAIMGLAGGLLQGNAGAGLQQGLLGYQRQAQINNQTARQSKMDAREDETYAREQDIQKRHDAIAEGLREQIIKMDPRYRGMNGPTQASADAMGQVDPEQLIAYQLAVADPLKNGAAFASSLKPKEPKYQAMGDTLLAISPGGIKEAWKKPEQIDPNKPFMVQNGQVVPNTAYQQFELDRASRGAARSVTNVINKQEGKEAEAVGKFFGESYADVLKGGMNAQGAMNRYNRLEQLLDGVDTGKFAPIGLEIAKGAEALGLRIDPNLANKEAAVALSSEIALQLRNPSGGAGMPGAMSDADRNFLAGMVPGIEKTPQGRKLILQTAKQLAKRDIEVANLARQYRQKRGTIDEGFYQELEQYSAQNPLFPRSPKVPQGGPRPPVAQPGAGVRFLGFE